MGLLTFVFIYCGELFKQFDGLFSLVHTEAERGKETQDVGRGSTRKDVLVVNKVIAEVLDRPFKLNTNHQALTTYVDDAWICLLQLLEFADKVVTHFGSVLY